MKKNDNPENITTMQIQREIALDNYVEYLKKLLDKNKEKEHGKKTTSKKES